jgi:hypothetical protein
MVAAAKKNGEEGEEVERSSCTPMGPLSVCERGGRLGVVLVMVVMVVVECGGGGCK